MTYYFSYALSEKLQNKTGKSAAKTKAKQNKRSKLNSWAATACY